MLYEPSKLGARCGECVLGRRGNCGPVPSELNPGAKVLLLGEAPNEDEVELERPFVGVSGHELDRALEAIGVRRDQVAIANVLECRPEKNDLRLLLHELQKVNKKRAAEGKVRQLTPMECCRPRLLKVLRQFHCVIALGATALRALTQGEDSILDKRGGPMEGYLDDQGYFVQSNLMPEGAHALLVLPTVHPAFAMRARRWMGPMRSDLAKAWRLFHGGLEWAAPKLLFHPTPQQVREFLQRARSWPFLAFDYETTIDTSPMTNQVRCLGVGNEREVMIPAWLSIDGHTRFYTAAEEEAVNYELAQYMRDRTQLKYGWNAAYFDKLVMKHHLGVDPKPCLDGILLHRGVASELPHNLGFVGSMYTDAPAWKSDHTATEAHSDFELHQYCGFDVGITAYLKEPLWTACEVRGQLNIALFDHKIQSACVDMHETGMFVAAPQVAKWDKQLRRETIEWRQKVRTIAGEDFNPGSFQQVGRLLFEKWGLPIQKDGLTELGEPSTGDEVLRGLLASKETPEDKKDFLLALRWYRQKSKARGTYIRRLVPYTQLIPEDDLSWDEETAAEVAAAVKRGDPKAKAKKTTGLILNDGRIHPNWSAHSVVSGRLAASHPSAQNWPVYLRDVIEPAPGNVFVAADMDQIELRFASAMAKAQNYLRIFAEGGDPHTWAALLISGPAGKLIYEQAVLGLGKKKAKSFPAWKRIRDYAKCVVGDTRVAVPGKGLCRIVTLGPVRPTRGFHSLAVPIPVAVSAGCADQQATGFYFGGVQPLLKVTLESGRELRGTARHRLQLVDGRWKRLPGLRAGDRVQRGQAAVAATRVQVPINPWVVKAKKGRRGYAASFAGVSRDARGLPKLEIGPEVGYLLGAIHGDGCISDYFVSVCGLAADGVLQQVEHASRYIGLKPWRKRPALRKRRSNPDFAQVTITTVAFVEFLMGLGMARGKRRRGPRKVMRVPDVIFQSPKDVITAYLAALLDTDGTVSSNGWSITSKSKKFCQDLQLLAEQLGLFGCIRKSWNAPYKRYYYQLTFNRYESRQLAAIVCPAMACRRKVRRARQLMAQWGPGRPRLDFDVVAGVTKAGRARVYDLVVPQGHAFSANGLVNHNTFQYAALYEAEVATIHDSITSTEDDNGKLIYLDLDVRMTRNSYDAWVKANSEFPSWWEDTRRLFRRDGFLREPVLGRQRDFLDGEEDSHNEIVNFQCQAGAASLVHLATVDLCVGQDAPLRAGRWGPGTGFIHQGHDALLFEVPEVQGEPMKNLVQEAMTRRVPGLDMLFTAEAKVSRSWAKAT